MKTMYQLTIFILFIGILPLPYLFYGGLRLMTMFVSGAVAYRFYKAGRSNDAMVFTFLAILFNPLFPFFFGKFLWVIIDLAAALFLMKNKEKVELLHDAKSSAIS